jgi:hypothetical protein
VKPTNDESDDLVAKKPKIDHVNTSKSDFDLSARKYIDWIDNIERILEEKSSDSHQRRDIIQVSEDIESMISSNESSRKLKRNIIHMMSNFKVLFKQERL